MFEIRVLFCFRGVTGTGYSFRNMVPTAVSFDTQYVLCLVSSIV